MLIHKLIMKIFKDICKVLREEKRAALATIIKTSGSAPAPMQSRMVVRFTDPITSIGTIGGGCLDAEILWKAEHERLTIPHFFTYSLDDPVGDTGLICGGTVEVMIEQIDDSMLEVYEAAAAEEAAGNDCVVVTLMHEGRRNKKVLFGRDGRLIAGGQSDATVLENISAAIAGLSDEHPIDKVEMGRCEYVAELIEARPSLVIFGGGHIGKVVAQCAALAGFSVTVVDDRKPFANKERFPEADRVLCEGFAQSFPRLKITPSTFVVIVTRGHRHDELVLEKVLEHEVRYVGMIGSERKVSVTLSHLREKGMPPERLGTVHAPIGIDIGARTAEEIGISIVAEVIAVRRKEPPLRMKHRAQTQALT